MGSRWRSDCRMRLLGYKEQFWFSHFNQFHFIIECVHHDEPSVRVHTVKYRMWLFKYRMRTIQMQILTMIFEKFNDYWLFSWKLLLAHSVGKCGLDCPRRAGTVVCKLPDPSVMMNAPGATSLHVWHIMSTLGKDGSCIESAAIRGVCWWTLRASNPSGRHPFLL
jgi:hypothetical protein